MQEKLKATQAGENVKPAEYNLAKMGAKQDLKGLKYSHEKGIKSYMDSRKKKITNVNQSQEQEQPNLESELPKN